MELQTKRCRIRNLKSEDLDDLFAVLSDPIVMKYIEPPFDRMQTAEFIKAAGLCDPPLVYGLEWSGTGALIGHVIWHPFAQEGYEIGWILHRDYWGMGIASEVTEALICYADQLNIRHLILEHSPQQTATKHIAEKFGFQILADGFCKKQLK